MRLAAHGLAGIEASDDISKLADARGKDRDGVANEMNQDCVPNRAVKWRTLNLSSVTSHRPESAGQSPPPTPSEEEALPRATRGI